MRILLTVASALLALTIVMCNGVVSSVHSAEVDQIELPFPAVLDCFKIEKVEKVLSYTATHHDKPYFVMMLDSNMDGKADTMLVFRVHRQDGDIYVAIDPSYIVLDYDYNGDPDEAFFIPVNGTCKDIKKVSLSEILDDHKGV